MTYEDLPAPQFTDPRNITVGQARVIWAKACGNLTEGWVIPGGWRTQNRFTAHEAANKINRMMMK